MTTLRLAIFSCCAALVCSLSAARAQAGVIDSFTNTADGDADSVSMTDSGFAVTQSFTITPPVTDPLGSNRFLSVQEFASGGAASTTVDGGVATFASSPGTSAFGSSADWQISYGVFGGGLLYDATDGGTADAFKLTFSSFTGGLEYSLLVNGYSGGGSSNGGLYEPLGSTVIVPFSSFSGAIDFTSINQIHILVRDGGLSHNGNATLDQFETVPEPATWTLLAAAILPVAGLIKRRRVR